MAILFFYFLLHDVQQPPQDRHSINIGDSKEQYRIVVTNIVVFVFLGNALGEGRQVRE